MLDDERGCCGHNDHTGRETRDRFPKCLMTSGVVVGITITLAGK